MRNKEKQLTQLNWLDNDIESDDHRYLVATLGYNQNMMIIDFKLFHNQMMMINRRLLVGQ